MPLKSIPLLQTLLERAEAERDAAQAQLKVVEQQTRHARNQADDLHQYRNEYDQRWVARFQQSGTPVLVQCHRNFGQRLDQAIDLQQTTAQQLDQRSQQARRLLLEREQRVAAVRKLIQRRQAEAQRVTDQREQRSTDEAAQRSHASHPSLAPAAG